MDKLWQTRHPPVPLDEENLPPEGEPLVYAIKGMHMRLLLLKTRLVVLCPSLVLFELHSSSCSCILQFVWADQ